MRHAVELLGMKLPGTRVYMVGSDTVHDVLNDDNAKG